MLALEPAAAIANMIGGGTVAVDGDITVLRSGVAITTTRGQPAASRRS
ncbi:MAG: hypothetical protein ACRD1K_06815 [Acidimicrobiales bacterium]